MGEKKILFIKILLPLAIAIISVFVLAKHTSTPEFHAKTIQSLDEKRTTVMELTAASAVAATGISMLPGDAATPIANKLTDLSSYFLLVICALYLEKYLLTVTGYATFGVLIPIACILYIINLFTKSEVCKMLVYKMIAFGLAIFLVVPVSVQVSNIIEQTYATSIQNTIDAVKQTKDLEDDTTKDEKGILADIFDKVQEGVVDATETVQMVLNNFIEALAVMIVTACIIPILVILFFVWLIKTIVGVNIPLSVSRKKVGVKNATEIQ